ncbi:MAG: PspC domain, partial [Ilumatobacteraceae bacterium]|nr:PspC domain [Ilumatobacteraceae bacterium]
MCRRERGKGSGRVGGVVAGLADAYGFDVRTSRIAVVVASFVVPLVPVLYLALWILLPQEPDPPTSFQAILHERRRLPLVVVLG